MPSTKAPMNRAGMVGSMIASLAAKRRNFWIVAQSYFTKLANVVQIFFDDPAKHVGFFAAFYGDDAALFDAACHRLLIR